MKNKLLIIASVLLVSSIAFFTFSNKSEEGDALVKLKEQHEFFLENSPFKETKLLPKAERIAQGLPRQAPSFARGV